MGYKAHSIRATQDWNSRLLKENRELKEKLKASEEERERLWKVLNGEPLGEI